MDAVLTRRRFLVASSMLVLACHPALAQDAGAAPVPPPVPAPAPENAPGSDFDTSYRPSASVSARVQREFLETVRWSAGAEMRDALSATFAERPATEIWLDLVKEDGLVLNNVADALTAYWVLNWITANAAYSARLNHAPIQRQLRIAFFNDPGFVRMSDQQKQELAEGYILNFLMEHAALNRAVAARDVETLSKLAAASVMRFQSQMGVNLLTLVPSAHGFGPRRTD